jgi:hypothetical protein
MDQSGMLMTPDSKGSNRAGKVCGRKGGVFLALRDEVLPRYQGDEDVRIPEVGGARVVDVRLNSCSRSEIIDGRARRGVA